MNRDTALRLINEEFDRVEERYGPQTTPHYGYAIILEELDELWDEIKANNGQNDRAVSEAVQVAASALRYLVDLCPDFAAKRHEDKVTKWPGSVPDSYGYRGTGGYSG